MVRKLDLLRQGLVKPNSLALKVNHSDFVIFAEVKNPKFTPLDRLLLVGLADKVQAWKQALLLG
jgi:hypothetical protein